MTFQRVLFADLDDSLMQSMRKCASDAGLAPAAFLKDGSACSFTTPRQRAFLDFVQPGTIVVPATARNHAAFRRVALPFASYAIVTNGGVVLGPDGVHDAAWHGRMNAAMAASLPQLEEIGRLIDAHALRSGLAARTRIVEDFGTPFYLMLKDPGGDAGNLLRVARDVIRPWADDGNQDFVLHLNDNNLALLPPALNKAHAVAYVAQRLREQHGELLTFGLGDSCSDAPFLGRCDYAIIPAGTQLSTTLLEVA